MSSSAGRSSALTGEIERHVRIALLSFAATTSTERFQFPKLPIVPIVLSLSRLWQLYAPKGTPQNQAPISRLLAKAARARQMGVLAFLRRSAMTARSPSSTCPTSFRKEWSRGAFQGYTVPQQRSGSDYEQTLSRQLRFRTRA